MAGYTYRQQAGDILKGVKCHQINPDFECYSISLANNAMSTLLITPKKTMYKTYPFIFRQHLDRMGTFKNIWPFDTQARKELQKWIMET